MTLENIKKHVGKDFAVDVDFIDECVKKLDLSKGSDILDVGTGLGIMSAILGLNGYEVLTGEPENFSYDDDHHKDDHTDEYERDFDYDKLDWRDTVNVAGAKDLVDFEYLNVLNLQFDNEEFDAVFLYDTLQHLKEYKKAIEECLRVVGSDGIVCIIETNKAAVERYNTEMQLDLTFIDPREYIDKNSVSVELIEGANSTMYKLRKQ